MINFTILVFSLISQIEPLPFEKLNKPILLSGKCSNIIIDEWQNFPKTKLNDAINHINFICNYSVSNVKNFLKSKNLEAQDIALKAKLSLLKYDGFRSLNDRSRFYFGNKVFDAKGIQLNQIGQYHYSSKRIFIDNQLYYDYNNFNSQFCSVFSHEIFHAVTKQNNLIEQMPEPHKTYDELYAVEFEKYIEKKMLDELFQ